MSYRNPDEYCQEVPWRRFPPGCRSTRYGAKLRDTPNEMFEPLSGRFGDANGADAVGPALADLLFAEQTFGVEQLTLTLIGIILKKHAANNNIAFKIRTQMKESGFVAEVYCEISLRKKLIRLVLIDLGREVGQNYSPTFTREEMIQIGREVGLSPRA